MRYKHYDPNDPVYRYCRRCSRRLSEDAPATQIYCTLRCCKAAHREKAKINRQAREKAKASGEWIKGAPYRPKCGMCGLEFSAFRSNATYCSDSCRRAAVSKREKDALAAQVAARKARDKLTLG